MMTLSEEQGALNSARSYRNNRFELRSASQLRGGFASSTSLTPAHPVPLIPPSLFFHWRLTMAKKSAASEFNMSEAIRGILTENSKLSSKEVTDAISAKYPGAKINK